MSEIQIRPMNLDDIEKVMDIELASFTSPWKEKSFRMELTENRFASYYVIANEEEVFGYCGLWVIFDEAQITNIAILPKHRGNQYGEQLFAYVLQMAKDKGANKLTLEVRVSNIVAQKLYRKYGLVPVGVRKNYYVDNQEDALLMWVKL